MHRFFFVSLVWFALLITGCAAKLWTCSATSHGQTGSTTVEASTEFGARNSGQGYDTCVAKSEPRETIVSEEYAAEGPFAGIPDYAKKDVGIGWRCDAMKGEGFRWRDGTETKELFRVSITIANKAIARMLAITGVRKHANDHHDQHLALMESWWPMTVDASIADTSNNSMRYIRVACWRADHPMPSAVQKWPAATWPRARTTIKNMPTGKPMSVPTGLVWDPDAYTVVDRSKCRIWDSTSRSFVETKATDAKRWTCRLALIYKPFVATSDGKELGSPAEVRADEKNLCGPATAARSGVEAALRSRAGPDVHLVSYIGECLLEK